MDFKGINIFSTGKATREEGVAINVIDNVERGADAVLRGTYRAVVPVARRGYDAMAPNADLWGAGFHFVRAAAGFIIAPWYAIAADGAMAVSAIGAAVRSRSITDRADANELHRSGLAGAVFSASAFAAGVTACLAGAPHLGVVIGMGAHAAGVAWDMGMARHDNWARQLDRAPSEVYDVDALASAQITVHDSGWRSLLRGPYVEIRDTRPFDGHAFGTLSIGANYHAQGYRTASVNVDKNEITYIRDTAQKAADKLVDEPQRQAKMKSVVDYCNAALASIESSKT